MNQLKKEEEEAMKSGTYSHTLSTESLGPSTEWKNVVSGYGK